MSTAVRKRPPRNSLEAWQRATQSARDKAEAAAEDILDAFRSGRLPTALPPQFIRPDDSSVEQFIDSLPAIEVARHWGIRVKVFDAEGADRLGAFGRNHIELGVRNLSTWAHELIHAADDRCIVKGLRYGAQVDQEVVAELGGAVLLEVLGFDCDADRGGAWELICRQCMAAAVDPVSACRVSLNRTCAAVALVLDTAAELAAEEQRVAAALEAEKQRAVAEAARIAEAAAAKQKLVQAEKEKQRQAEEDRQRRAEEEQQRRAAAVPQFTIAAEHDRRARMKRPHSILELAAEWLIPMVATCLAGLPAALVMFVPLLWPQPGAGAHPFASNKQLLADKAAQRYPNDVVISIEHMNPGSGSDGPALNESLRQFWARTGSEAMPPRNVADEPQRVFRAGSDPQPTARQPNRKRPVFDAERLQFDPIVPPASPYDAEQTAAADKNRRLDEVLDRHLAERAIEAKAGPPIAPPAAASDNNRRLGELLDRHLTERADAP